MDVGDLRLVLSPTVAHLGAVGVHGVPLSPAEPRDPWKQLQTNIMALDDSV